MQLCCVLCAKSLVSRTSVTTRISYFEKKGKIFIESEKYKVKRQRTAAITMIRIWSEETPPWGVDGVVFKKKSSM